MAGGGQQAEIGRKSVLPRLRCLHGWHGQFDCLCCAAAQGAAIGASDDRLSGPPGTGLLSGGGACRAGRMTFMPPAPKYSRRFFQFSLRKMFVIVTLIACWISLGLWSFRTQSDAGAILFLFGSIALLAYLIHLAILFLARFAGRLHA